MAETTIVLNPGAAGASVATFADATSRQHQEVIIQTQSGAGDPVSVNSGAPLPVTVVNALSAGANVIGGVTQSGAFNISGDKAPSTADAGANPVKVGGVFNTSPPLYTTGQRTDLQTDSAGNVKVNIVAGAAAGGTSSNFAAAFPTPGTAIGAKDGSNNMQPLAVDGGGNLKVNIAAGGVASLADNGVFTSGTTAGLPLQGVFNDGISALTSGSAGTPRVTAARQLLVAPQANPVGGWTPFRLVSAASTNATSLKGSAGTVGTIMCGNNGAALAYLKLYNKASAPTVGTDTPVQTLMIPGNAAGAGFTYAIPAGLAFSTGIAFALTGAMADADTTAVAAAQVCVNFGYL